ncbi:MAG: 50S ribosomal protein L11 methyltransferase [Terriglobales bacterium]
MSTDNLLAFHHWLLADTGRTGAYQRAISQIVRKNDVVLDIGAGTGILSFLACLAGARKVYAVEASDALQLARELSTRNGFDGKVEFLQHLSQNIQLPELVDVIVSDTGASFGLQGRMLGSLLDAKERFLKPGGRIIPQSLQLLMAPVDLKDGRNLDVWEKDRYGLDLSSIRPFAANTNYQATLKPEDVLGSPALLAEIRFEEVNSPYVAGESVWVAERDGVMHGLGAWMMVELAPGICFTNSPLAPTVDWNHSFFPVETPVELQTGNSVRINIRTNNGEVWRWQVEVTNGSASGASSPGVKARFDQSTMWSFPVAPERMKKLLPSYIPKLSRKGEAEKYLLSAFDGQRTAADLTAELLKNFGDCFPSKASASQFVTRLIGRST